MRSCWNSKNSLSLLKKKKGECYKSYLSSLLSIPISRERYYSQSFNSIANRKGVRACTKYLLAYFVSYHHLGHNHKALTTALSSEIIPKNIIEILGNPKWRDVVFEEMRALHKNET